MEDLDAFGFEMPPARLRAWTGLIDGETVAIGGYWYTPGGEAVAFLNAKPCVKTLARLTLWKTAQRVLADAKQRGLTQLYARPEEGNEAAPRFLMRLGFEPVNGRDDLFVRQA